ncbi:hypothetical protein M404DRAFT_10270 [Pisolithus tinctorius Marx 270]|uniref:Alpha-type protein kinase domain-containing protein n=1 Tax=Pisolithus tinctorius Marx 270 TaxID=870435 RepID=A0A0C3IT05_PISTI|nr:hypothetical protein M404DRAFT_10270 [Pisolithus tinctorius Marx 270]
MAILSQCEASDGDGCGQIFPHKLRMAILSWCEASDGDGCGQIFPHKTRPGICAKCHKLASFQAGSADIKLWQAMPQWKGCGMAWKNLQGEMCGTCETASPAANQVGNCDSSTGTSQVVHDAIETPLGLSDICTTEVLKDSLTALNVNWEKDEGLGLVLGEVQFCFPGNKNFQPGDQTKTVGYVYNAYMLGKSADFYKPRDAQSKEVKGPALFLELYVDCEAVQCGEVEIVWPDDSLKTIKGFLGSDLFSKGWTKKVYKWFLGHFCELAKQQGVSIFSEIVFSEGFLLCEHEMSSAASGELDCGNYYGGAVWLVEPRQTTTVMKFSGTLEHPSSMDKLGITFSAFAHFAYEYSKHKLVFADIQGSPMTVNGHDGMVLFDVMTHTVTSYGNQLHHSVKLLIPLK